MKAQKVRLRNYSWLTNITKFNRIGIMICLKHLKRENISFRVIYERGNK